MTPDTSGWRTSPGYDFLDQLIAPDLAWECLRRNRDYQRDYADTERPAPDLQIITEGVRLRWGLRLPRPTDPQCHRDDGVLGAGD